MTQYLENLESEYAKAVEAEQSYIADAIKNGKPLGENFWKERFALGRRLILARAAESAVQEALGE